MIKFAETHLEVSRAVCKALLAFASKDKLRPHLSAIGFDRGDPCATDGHTAVWFMGGTGAAGAILSGRVFSREYAETQLKIAVATKSETVSLEWSRALQLQFPPISQVEKADFEINSKEPIGVNAAYLARLDLVAKACTDTKAPCVVQVHSVTGALEPLGFEFNGNNGMHARVTIMPARL